MIEEARYVYSMVRVVPNSASGEFVVLAVVAGSDQTGDWAIRPVPDERRIRQFAGHHPLMAGHDFVTRTGLMIDLDAWMDDFVAPDVSGLADLREMHVSESWLLETSLRNRHVVQLSSPIPILAESAEHAIDLVLATIVQPRAEARRRTLTKRTLLASMNRSYEMVGLIPREDYSRKVPLVARGPRPFRHTMDFTVVEGEALQLVQAWSFQISEQADLARDVKAWGWIMRELREYGGDVHALGRRVRVPNDVSVEVVLAPPEEGAGEARRAAYNEAVSVFSELEIPMTEHGMEGEVAGRAADLIGRFNS